MAGTPPAAAAPGSAVLAPRDVTTSFGSVAALRGAQLQLHAGTAHALVGGNGAGTSTLVEILTGVHGPSSGQVLLDGRPVTLGSRRVDRARLEADCRALVERLGVALDPGRPARGLSIAGQQTVEIAEAISSQARVLVMHEPTAALSGVEVERLFTVARALRDGGAGVLLIPHRVDEASDLCDTITVMRDGQWVATSPAADLAVDQVIRMMVGRDVSELFPEQEVTAGDVVLEVRGLGCTGVFSDVSFDVRAGEIVAPVWLVGAGRSEVVRAVFGIDHHDAGSVRIGDTALEPGNPAAARAAVIALVPEDHLGRRTQRHLLGAGPGPGRRDQRRHRRFRPRVPRRLDRPGDPAGHRRDPDGPDGRADRRAGPGGDPVGHGERDEPERLDRDGHHRPRQRRGRGRGRGREVLPGDPGPAADLPRPGRDHLPDHRRHSRRPPATCQARSTRPGRAGRSGHSEPDARARRGRHGHLLRAVEPRGPRPPGCLGRCRSGLRPVTGADGETFTAGDLAEYTIGDDGAIVLGDPTVFDAQNIDDFDF